MSEDRPRYRLQVGRRPNRDASPSGASRAFQVRFPLDLWQEVWDNCREPDVAKAVSGHDNAYINDYVRCGTLLLSILLRGGTRERVLAFINLPDSRMDDVIAHLEFVYATLPAPVDPNAPAHVIAAGDPPNPGIDPNLHADMYMRQEGVKKQKKGKAPLAERDPWNKL